jgi:hypothetical protein
MLAGSLVRAREGKGQRWQAEGHSVAVAPMAAWRCSVYSARTERAHFASRHLFPAPFAAHRPEEIT